MIKNFLFLYLYQRRNILIYNYKYGHGTQTQQNYNPCIGVDLPPLNFPSQTVRFRSIIPLASCAVRRVTMNGSRIPIKGINESVPRIVKRNEYLAPPLSYLVF
jgi:hypothetical protein